MSDIEIGQKTDAESNDIGNESQKETLNFDDQVLADRKRRVLKAKNELLRVCKKYRVTIYVDPIIMIMAEKKISRNDKKAKKAIEKTRRKMEKLFKRHKTFMKVNPSVELRPDDKRTDKRIITEDK